MFAPAADRRGIASGERSAPWQKMHVAIITGLVDDG